VSLFDKSGGINPKKATGRSHFLSPKETRCDRSPPHLHLVRTASFTTFLVNPLLLKKIFLGLHVPEQQNEGVLPTGSPEVITVENE